MKDYVKVFTAAGVIITRQSMAALEAMLPSKNFIRTHRSFIVSLPKIKSFTGEMIDIEKGATIPIGKLYKNEVMRLLES